MSAPTAPADPRALIERRIVELQVEKLKMSFGYDAAIGELKRLLAQLTNEPTPVPSE